MSMPNASPSHVGAAVAAVFVGVWAAVVALISQTGGWLASQITLALSADMPGYVWVIIGVVSGILAGGPALALALIPRHPSARLAGRAWTVGAGVLAIGTALRAIPGPENDLYLFAYA